MDEITKKKKTLYSDMNLITYSSIQIKYSLSCLQCPTLYAQMDEKSGEAVQISKPIPLPALNVRIRFVIQKLLFDHVASVCCYFLYSEICRYVFIKVLFLLNLLYSISSSFQKLDVRFYFK